MAEEIKKSYRNLFDEKNGLPIMVNLYIIKYIYYHIKKADCFMVQKNTGKKPKSYPIYQNEIPISRQRFNRINKGIRFEISSREATEITERFGIESQYFRKNKPVMFTIQGIEEKDWKGFYLARYGVKYKLPKEYEKGEENYLKACEKKIEEALKELVRVNWEARLAPSDPLFAICYYFSYGTKRGEIRAETLHKLLEEMDYREWEKQERESLKKIQVLLKNHLEYIDSILMIEDLQKEREKRKEKKVQEEKK